MTFNEMHDIIRPMLDDKRYKHSLAVEVEAGRLARIHHADEKKARIAAIFHDMTKNYTLEDSLKLVASSDIITDIIFQQQPYLIHGFSASVLVQQYGIEDSSIINAIRYHTVARANMTPLEKIVYLADLTCEGRTYPDVSRLRDIVGQSLDEGMLYALSFTISSLTKNKRCICKDTWEAYNEQIKKIQEETHGT